MYYYDCEVCYGVSNNCADKMFGLGLTPELGEVLRWLKDYWPHVILTKPRNGVGIILNDYRTYDDGSYDMFVVRRFEPLP